MKTKYLFKETYFKLLIFIFITFLLTSCQENQYDSNGFKDGTWTEYIIGDGSKEVIKDSAQYIRKVKYNHGTPTGMGKDYYPNGSLQCEYYLISEKYKKDFRPKDKYKGLVIWFTKDTTNINQWNYYDDYGNVDLKKYYITGFDEISKDPRFDKKYFLSVNQSFDVTIKLFNEFNNNPSKYDEEVNKIISRIYSKPDLVNLIKNDTTGYMLSLGISYGLMNLVEKTDENTVDSNPESINENNDYNSNDYNTIPDQSTTQNNYNNSSQNYEKPKEKCSSCYGTGKCSTCGKVQQDGYYNRSGSYIRISEIRTGMIICDKCHGRGTFGSDYDSPCGWCQGQGWSFCKTCNYNGRGSNVGQCQSCRGSGFRN